MDNQRSPALSLSQLYNCLFKRRGAAIGLLLRVYTKLPRTMRPAAFETVAIRIAEIDSAVDRAQEIDSAGWMLQLADSEEFEQLLDTIGDAGESLTYMPRCLRSASEKVRHRFVFSALREVARFSMEIAVEHFELLVPMLPAEELRRAVTDALETRHPVPMFLERMQSWPAEVQVRAITTAAPLLTTHESVTIADYILGATYFADLLPAIKAIFPTLDEATRETFLAIARERMESDSIVRSHLPDVLQLLQPAPKRSEWLRDVIDPKKVYLSVDEMGALAQLLDPQDILWLLESQTGWNIAHLWASALPYLDLNSIPRALELIADRVRESERESLLFGLMARLGPAAFVETFLASPIFSSWKIWRYDSSLDSFDSTVNALASGRFESPAEFQRTFRRLGSLRRSQFASVLGIILRPAIEFGRAPVIQAVLDAAARTSKWWP